MLRNSPHSFGWPARWLHWLTAAAVIAALVFIETKDWFPRGSATRAGIFYAHVQAGLIAFLLVVPRLAWRLANRSPGITPPLSRRMQQLSDLTHWLMYALILCLPVLGLLSLQAKGTPPALFGLPLPLLTEPAPTLAHGLKDWHENLGNVLLWLAILHVLAAWWHHKILRDDTLTRLTGPWRP